MIKNQTLKTVGFVLKEARPYWRYLAVVLVSMLIYIAADFVHPFIYRSIINTVSQPSVKPDEVFSRLIWLIVFLAIALTVHRLFRDAAGFCLLRAEVKTMARVANKIFKHVTNLSYDFHTSRFAGSTARKINRGVARIEDLMDVIFYDLTPTVVSMVVSVSVLAGTSLIIGAPLAISLLIFVLVTILLVKKRMTFDYQANSREAKASGIMVDSLINNLTVKTFTGEQKENSIYRHANRRWAKSAIRSWDWDVWTSIFQGSFVVLLEIAMLMISLGLWRKGQFTVGDVVFVESNLGLLMFPLWTLGRFYRNFRRAEVDLFDVLELLNTKSSIQPNHNLPDLNMASGEISFRDVSFVYRNGRRNAINNLSLNIKAGEKVALVGRSGAGKSTFIKLLFRFVESQTGMVEIDH